MEIDAVVATTHAIDRGTYSVRITKEALEDGVSQINGSSATRMIVNHDPLCLPIGKAKAAWLREREDGEWELVNRFYIDDQAITLTIERAGGDGPLEELAIVQFPEDPRPFLSGAKGFDTDLAAGVEIVNFRDPHSFDAFRDDVVASNENVSVYTIERHEFGPEPFIQFVVDHFSVWQALAIPPGGWLVSRLMKHCNYVVDQLLKEAADGVVDALRPKIRRIFDRYRERAVEDDRSTLVGIQLNASPVVKLYARVSECNNFPEIELASVVEALEKYEPFLSKAREVVLEWDGEGWRFRYATSNEGEVLGTKECFEYTMKQYRRLNRPHGED